MNAFEAAAPGHLLLEDPPASGMRVQRWTCVACGRAVLRTGHFYGSAVTEECDGVKDTRGNALHAYAAFMSMPQSEWLGLLASIAQGGVLELAEQEGFERALEARHVSL